MEPKKAPKLDLESKRVMFFNIGLALSLGFVFMAFEWKSAERILVVFPEEDDVFEEPYEVQQTVIKPPKPPVAPPVLKVVEDEIEVIEEIEIPDIEFDPNEIIEVIEYDEPEPEIADEVTTWTEVMPTPEMGIDDFYKFISRKIKYPSRARMMGIEGRVFVQFVIDKQGSITNIKTIKGIGGGCDEEAERVLGLSPKWRPGRQGERLVSVRMVLPIVFSLGG